jgi:hypothetical protein
MSVLTPTSLFGTLPLRKRHSGGLGVPGVYIAGQDMAVILTYIILVQTCTYLHILRVVYTEYMATYKSPVPNS